MRLLLSIILFFTSGFSFGQKYLNDTSLLGSIDCIYNSAYESDSGIYVNALGAFPQHGNMYHLLLAFYDSLGQPSVKMNNFDTINVQDAYSSMSDLICNDRGNFVYYFKNCDTLKCYTRIKEVSPTGQVLKDIKLDTLAAGIADYNDFIQKKYDSSYAMTLNSSAGLIYVHLDKHFNALNVDTFTNVSPWFYAEANLVEGANGDLILTMCHMNIATIANQQANVVMRRLDANDVEMDSVLYSDGLKIDIPLGLCRSLTGGYFFTYARGQWDVSEWKYYYYLCKLDESFTLVWKTKLEPVLFPSYNQFGLQQQIKPTLDSNYVVVGAFATPETVYTPEATISAAVLRKFNEQGTILWQRYIYLPIESGHEIGIEIKNVIATRDSGYCMVGARTDLTVAQAGQKGYIVKTNCLGFLGAPEAAAAHQVNQSLSVDFFNTSTQAGSYRWDFGDGTSLQTGEGEDTLNHLYADTGTYQVQLIAYGCSGENDTLRFAVVLQGATTPPTSAGSVTHGAGYFSLFPNPVATGQNVYVYLNALNPASGQVYMLAYSLEGKLIERYTLSPSEGTYLLEQTFASGVYALSLFQGDTKLATKKLVVE